MRKIPVLPPELGHENEVVAHNHGKLGEHVHAPHGIIKGAIATPRAASSTGAPRTDIVVDMEIL